MRTTISLSALALILSLAPASAMCGGGMMGGQQAQSSGQGSSMTCGRPSQSTQAEDPFGLKQSKPQPQQQQMGMMCPCCRGMAMMQGGGMMKMDVPHKGMDMPKQ